MGYRAKVKFQPWPVVKDLATGYGFPQNAYSKTARVDTKIMDVTPSKIPAPLANGHTVEPPVADLVANNTFWLSSASATLR